MHLVDVTIRTRDNDKPPGSVEGYAPTPDCALCVTRWHIWSDDTGAWTPDDDWCITHRPTGLQLASKTWPTRAAALDVLEKCDPAFPAWLLASGAKDCAATAACRVKFRWACDE